uniref:RING-type E3 ubiquitin transferase n=1 Tax=Rhizophora mucronata TaxID=61149 RepID=A0A2P2Q5U4_RHIMU
MSNGGFGGGDGDGNASVALLLGLVREITAMSAGGGGGGSVSHCDLVFRKSCTNLGRRVSLLTHFLEDMSESGPVNGLISGKWCSDLLGALQVAKRFLLDVSTFKSSHSDSDGIAKKISSQFQSVTLKLENALANMPYDQFDVSEEVKEEVALLRSQLQKAIERYGPMNSKMSSLLLAHPVDKENILVQKLNRLTRSWHVENGGSGITKLEVIEELETVSGSDGSANQIADLITSNPNEVDGGKKDSSASYNLEEFRKTDEIPIPEDFLCPISLELLRDPVIVATGQTYERSYIQRWIDAGNTTCPKTQQKLENLTLTPNFVLRSLITEWRAKHKMQQSKGIENGRLKRSDGSFCDVSQDMVAIHALVQKLSSQSIEEHRAAVSEIRLLSKRCTDNRILIAEEGAIPVLVNLLASEDLSIQENAVTSILNLSIYENNKELIMLAHAIPSIVQILRAGSVEARENAAATLFSLSLSDENKIIIGASGAIPALVELLENGSPRGKKDAATALFNLCIYQGNKGRAVRAGIVKALLKMLTDLTNGMVDEALTILSVLASNQEAKVAIVKASTIPVLIDLLRTGQPRSKENAAAILLSLCKWDPQNLACISRLGAAIPLTELANSGTERARQKATSLLVLLRRLQQL